MEASTATAPAPTETVNKVAEHGILNATHRCDKGGCGARAFVRVSIKAGDLYFCGHHWEADIKEQIPAGDRVDLVDERSKLVKPSTAVL